MRRLKYYGKFLKSLFGTIIRLMWGMWKLTKLPQPAITIFGGARVEHGSEHAEKSQQIAKRLVAQGFSIITGGGPGIMESANKGAMDHLIECQLEGRVTCRPLVSAGIGLLRLNKEKTNPYVQENIVMEYFFARKWLLVRYAVGFVIFPGGFGTLDELFEILTLIQTKRMKKYPIVLMHSTYWKPILDWMDCAIKEGLMSPEDRDLLHVTDDVDQAMTLLSKECKNFK